MRLVLACLLLAACEGPAGPQGPAGTNGSDGSNGTDGSNGGSGSQGQPGVGSWLTGPGVDITVTGLAFDAQGAHVTFTLKDGAGVPLDIAGHYTSGAVNTSFVLAQQANLSDGSPGQYTAYTKRTVTKQFPTPDPTVTAVQATTESTSAGTLEVQDVTQGKYRYTFAANVTAMAQNQTQSVIGLAVRTLDGVQTIDRDLFSMRPDGSTVQVRQDVTDATCFSCHKQLDAHGGRYVSPSQCVLCHTPQTSDPDSGNTVDFRVMIHKIHKGAELASLKADPTNHYAIIGFGGSVQDFSTVEFPGPVDGGNTARCETCHAGTTGDRWKTMPSQTACTSCHDTTVFTATDNPPFTVKHSGGTDPALVNDQTCNVCHAPTAGVAPITAAHYKGVFSPTATQLAITIDSVTNGGPGQNPTINFTVNVNGAPRDILASPLTSLSATIAGPTTDIADYWQAKVQGSGAVGTVTAIDAANGKFAYTLPATGCSGPAGAHACAIPANATGSYEAGFEGYIQAVATDPRSATFAPVATFAVTDATPQPRRTIVAAETCNQCHLNVSGHGGSRTNPNYCVFCHNPNKANDTRISRFEGSTVLAEPVDLRVMIHKIHAGENLSQPYFIGAFPAPTVANPAGTMDNFGEIRYPRELTDCNACHVAKNWTLPMANSPAYLPSTALEMTCTENPANDTDNFCGNTPPGGFVVAQTIKIPPQTSVCTSCHDAPYTAAHAQLNTTPAGVEACVTCHGPGKDWDVGKLHGTP